MDFLNKAKDSFAAAGKGFTQKANDVSGIAKVTMKMKEEEKQLQNALTEIGTQLYNLHNEEAKAMFPELAEQIRVLYAEMEKDRVDLAFLKGKKICPNCGAELEGDIRNCTSCGMNVENVQRPTEVPAFCGNCGNPLSEGSKFCQNCGAKVEN